MAVFRPLVIYLLVIVLSLLLSSCYQEQFSVVEGDNTEADGAETGDVVERQGDAGGKAEDVVTSSDKNENETDSNKISENPGGRSEAKADSDKTPGNSGSKSEIKADSDNNSEMSGKYPASVKPGNFRPGYYMGVGEKDSITSFNIIAGNPDFVGVKKRYAWNVIEPKKGEYDFSEIVADLEYLQSIGKHLWISIQTTTFSSDGLPRVPAYMWKNSRYGCGNKGEYYGSYKRTSQQGGWLPCRGNSDFDERFEALLTALGKRFNREPYFEGLNLAETSTGKRADNLSSTAELQAFKGAALAAKRAFPDKTVMQMINYSRFDLSAFADWLLANGIATGGPDMHVENAEKGSLALAYSTHKKNRWKTPNGIDVQWDNWSAGGKPKSSRELIDAAVKYINPWYLFWDKKPGVFKEDVVPTVRKYGPLPAVKQLYSSNGK